ncbi:MFS transporter [Orrella sp. JC864]|uniref:MFS transporter n=1 Tax=Orrella sp. JC864 TaxID=3120298 RepID=UPI0012BB6EC1
MGNHMALTGGRIAVALTAIALGLSTFMVGMAMALFAVLPMLLSVRAGRLIDAIGVRRPMKVGAAMTFAGCALPCAWNSRPALLLAAVLVGTGFMMCQVATQNHLGNAEAGQRLRNFSLLSLMQAVSGFGGPLLTGLAIDHLGYRYAFGLLALPPLLSLWGVHLLRRRLARPPPPLPGSPTLAPPRVRDLVAIAPLRRVLLANMTLSGAWDTHLFIVPIFGVSIGLSATTIGVVLSCFAAATFVVRLLLPVIQRYLAPWKLVTVAMFMASASFLLYPLFDTVAMLMAMSFLLGLALGSCQPSLLALLHQHSPPGRAAEAAGIRMALINTTQMSVPMAFGALGAAVGLAPLFWAYSLILLSSAWRTRKLAFAPRPDHRE